MAGVLCSARISAVREGGGSSRGGGVQAAVFTRSEFPPELTRSSNKKIPKKEVVQTVASRIFHRGSPPSQLVTNSFFIALMTQP